MDVGGMGRVAGVLAKAKAPASHVEKRAKRRTGFFVARVCPRAAGRCASTMAQAFILGSAAVQRRLQR